MNLLTQQVLNQSWTNSSLFAPVLSNWQQEQLNNLTSQLGVQCLLQMWFNYTHNYTDNELLCNATWDNIYCWPPTPSGTTITRLCSEAFQQTQPAHAYYLEGLASRTCLENGTWSQGIRTNYDECATSYEAYEKKTIDDRRLVSIVQHMLFVGSILSLVCLATALSIFYRFRCLWCDRITVHAHLMLALVLRFILLLIITEPFVMDRSSNYRDVDVVCKAIIAVYLYATVASVSWMFIQGLYLNRKLTTNVFTGPDTNLIFKIYYLIGWVVPAALLLIYLIAMLTKPNQEHCWKGYADMPEMWVLLAPMIFALLLNAVFLLNILRIVLEKVRSANMHTDSSQLLAAAKATLILFPVLGINNLLVLHNPGGDYEKYYVLLNTFFGSAQGIFVSIVYCFNNQEVKDAIRRSYNRVVARRMPTRNSTRNNLSHCRRSTTLMMVQIPREEAHQSEDTVSQHTL